MADLEYIPVNGVGFCTMIGRHSTKYFSMKTGCIMYIGVGVYMYGCVWVCEFLNLEV